MKKTALIAVFFASCTLQFKFLKIADSTPKCNANKLKVRTLSQHFTRMGAGGVGYIHAAEHAGDFVNSLVCV